MDWSIRRLLIEAEFHLDNHNAQYGTKEKYCLCCYSTHYDGSVGIIHYPDCLIRRIRSELNKKND